MHTKPISFINMFGQQSTEDKINIDCIEIPIIQRDYAQGRETKDISRIRKQFLNVLFNSLIGKTEPVKLDFVYGNITNGKLIPLDGQQILTTLYLIHWYIAKHEDIVRKNYTFLRNFTYKTRFSSRHFCESLILCSPDFGLETISEWLRDQHWFMYSWEKDPTIHSMLVMLDDIHLIFKNESGLWEKLSEKENPFISFYFLPLEDMGLSDSLYIKMNSRGKPLTPFEHFKAEFEKTIKAVSSDLYKEFVHKVDNDWVDMLWKFRGYDDIIDDEFMKYYRFVTEMICFQNEIEIVENDFDLAQIVYSIQNQSAEYNLRFLFNAFDCWTKLGCIDSFFDSSFSKYQFENGKVKIYSDDTNLFRQCCNDYGIIQGGRRKFSLNTTLLLFGVLQYLMNNAFITKEEFAERIRIVRNLVLNSTFEIRETRMQALLSDTQNVVLKGEINFKTLGYNEIQKNEEIDKIEWRKNNNTLVVDINHLEDHFLLQGSIAIIGLDTPEMFKLRASNFRTLFNHEINYLDISKALLTLGDYSQLVSWRYLLGNTNDSTWRELFTVSNQRKHFDQTRITLLQLLDSINNNFNDYIILVNNIYLQNPDIPKDWRYYFVKYPAMRKGKSGVYWWRNDQEKVKSNQYEVFMMNTAFSLNGKHWDPFLYTLYSDETLKNELTLEEYGHALIINKTNERVKCMNCSWEIVDSNNLPLQSIEILQEGGIDVLDRIVIFKEYIHSIIN